MFFSLWSLAVALLSDAARVAVSLAHGTSVAFSHEDDLQHETLSIISPDISNMFYWNMGPPIIK